MRFLLAIVLVFSSFLAIIPVETQQEEPAEAALFPLDRMNAREEAGPQPLQYECISDEAGTSEETAGLLSGEMVGLQEAAESKQEQVHTVQDSAGTAGQNWTCEEDLLARIIACEMGCNWIPDEQQLYVGSVVLNRVASDLFPDTLQAVIYQPGQYAPAISGWLETVQPDERTRENARWLLENGSVLPENVLYQSTVVQGEVYASYYDETLGTTTYYCFGG